MVGFCAESDFNRVRTRRHRRVPLRTVRASFPVYSSSPREAARNRATGSLSFKRTYLSSTVVVPRRSAEGADTVSGALSCSPSVNSDYDSVSRDRAEVCLLSRKVMLQPLSLPLQYGPRFFRLLILRLLIPARPTTFLAVRLPRGQSYGLTTFPFHHTTGSGLAVSPVDICDDIPRFSRGATRHPPFGQCLSAALASYT